jgi:Uma2 family endonuclease
MTTALLTQLTAEEFFARSVPDNGEREELVDGEIITMPLPGLLHAEVQAVITILLGIYLKSHPIGRVFGEAGVITYRDPDSVRGPDLCFYSQARLALNQTIVGYHSLPPDLCVEVRSPSNTLADLTEKAHEYLAAGVKMVWIADPMQRTLTVIAEETRTYQAHETLTAEAVLPGFACVVAELFAA